MGKTGGIWIVAEQVGTRVSEVSLELLTKARDLDDDTRMHVYAVLPGYELTGPAQELLDYGAEIVYTMDDPRLNFFQSDLYALVLEDLFKRYLPEIVLWGATSAGKELAPTLAARLNTGLAAHCVDLKIKAGRELIAVIPAFGGNMLGEILFPRNRPQMASIKPGIFRKAALDTAAGRIIKESTDVLNGYASPLEILGLEEVQGRRQPIEEAEIVIAGGFGVGSQENWRLLEEFAAKLSGAVGCTRPALDAGWIKDESTMIGTSGRTVHPGLYLGFGISGATHHVVGMKDAKTIINVNTDSNAQVFDVSDYKVVADAQAVLEALLEIIKQT